MTAIAIWPEPSDGALWSVADTRLSSPGDSGGQIVRTDSAAKLYVLPVHCHHFLPGLPGQKMAHYSTSFGYAFAGDITPAMMTIATASTFLSNLTTVISASPPPLADVAELVRNLSERFSRDVLSSSGGKYGWFESAVYGWCPVLRRFSIYYLKIVCDPFAITSVELLPTSSDQILILGSGKKRLLEQIEKIKTDGDKFGRTARMPKLALEAIVDEDKGDVGGSLSIGIASQSSFDLYSECRPIEPGKPAAKLSFNGIDFDEHMRSVGHYFIGLNAMA